jgi:hypothetical protein
VQYAEPVFRALVKAQAQRDEISDLLIETAPTHPTPLAISAPLRSGDHRTVIANTTYELDISWLTANEQIPSYLVLWDWQANAKLCDLLAWGEQKKIPIFLGVTQFETTDDYIEKLVDLLKGTSVVEGILFHRPPYIKTKESGLDKSLVELLQKYIPVIFIEQDSEFQITSSLCEICNEHISISFIEWLSLFIHQRLQGKDIKASVDYTQIRFR